MAIQFKVIIAVLLFLMASCEDNLRSLSNVEEISDMQQLMNLLAQNDKVVIDFYATWCGPCKNIAPYYDSLAQAYQPYGIKCIRVNVDVAYPVTEWAQVSAMPTFLFLFKSNPFARIVGADAAGLKAQFDVLFNKK